MNTKQFIKHIEGVYEKCLVILKQKNADYSSNSDNPFRNFELVELLQLTDTKTGMGVRLSDKLSRICNLLKKDPQVVEEKLEDTIMDAINYLAIMHARITSEKQK